MGRALLDAVLPPLCLGCNEIVGAPGALCTVCWQGFSFISASALRLLRTPFVEDLGARGAVRGLPHPPPALSSGPRGLWCMMTGQADCATFSMATARYCIAHKN